MDPWGQLGVPGMILGVGHHGWRCCGIAPLPFLAACAVGLRGNLVGSPSPAVVAARSTSTTLPLGAGWEACAVTFVGSPALPAVCPRMGFPCVSRRWDTLGDPASILPRLLPAPQPPANSAAPPPFALRHQHRRVRRASSSLTSTPRKQLSVSLAQCLGDLS